jgi:hypothetical protein
MRQKRKLKYADFLLPLGAGDDLLMPLGGDHGLLPLGGDHGLLPLSEDDLLPLSEGDLNNLLRPIDDVVADPDPAEPHDPTGGPVKTS